MDLELNNRRVLITGGSRGIGLAIAQSFAREGAMPILVSRSAESLEKAAARLRAEHACEVQVIAADLAEDAGVQKVQEVIGSVDILVNNAGAIPGGRITAMDDSQWRKSWELKVFGYIHLMRSALAAMETRGSGVIANVIGMAGVSPRDEYIAGSSANAALIAMTQGIGAASVRHGVRVFGVNPSATRSDRMETMLRSQAERKWGDPERWKELTVGMPFGRLMEPAEVADMVVFGCSPRAGYLSGSVINLDGGQTYAAPR